MTMSLSDEEFNKIRNALSDRLIAAAFADKQLLEGWRDEVARAFIEKAVDGVADAIQDFLNSRRKRLNKFLKPLTVERSRRVSACDCCRVRIEREALVIHKDTSKFCTLCGFLLATASEAMYTTFVEELRKIIGTQPVV